MKKRQAFLLIILVCILAYYGTARADIPQDDLTALAAVDSFDAQLALLDKIAVENATELEDGYWGWNSGLTVDAAPGIPTGIIPKDWESVPITETDTLPNAMRSHKFIVLYLPGDASAPQLAGGLLARFPSAMRAASLTEAEYALIVRYHLVPSGYIYNPPASSFHRDYEAYLVDLKTGEFIRFWTHRNEAKTHGAVGVLDGSWITEPELWEILRAKVFPERQYTQTDGTVLLFGLTDDNYFLKGFEGMLRTLDVPTEVEGYPVTEVAAGCFKDNETLKTVHLPEGLRRIGNEAFANCSNLESVELPNTLETIGGHAFKNNKQLMQIVLPDSLTNIGEYAFSGCTKLARVVFGEGLSELNPYSYLFSSSRDHIACCYVPANLTDGLIDAEIGKSAVIYGPEGSYAHQWATENGYEVVACDDPEDMPDVTYITEGDFEFRVFNGEAALFRYLGHDVQVIIPETANSVPVTRILRGSFEGLSNMETVWLPGSIKTIDKWAMEFGEVGENKPFAIIHAPQGSYALQWAAENGYEHIVNDNPNNVSDIEYITEGDFEFRIFNGEAALYRYQGEEEQVIIPETASGIPVTRILSGVFEGQKKPNSVHLPDGIKTVDEGAIQWAIELGGSEIVHVYIPGKETNLQDGAIDNILEIIVVHAPEGSLAQRYVIDQNNDKLIFEAVE